MIYKQASKNMKFQHKCSKTVPLDANTIKGNDSLGVSGCLLPTMKGFDYIRLLLLLMCHIFLVLYFSLSVIKKIANVYFQELLSCKSFYAHFHTYTILLPLLHFHISFLFTWVKLPPPSNQMKLMLNIFAAFVLKMLIKVSRGHQRSASPFLYPGKVVKH